jgi:hypothetical protein
MGATSTGAGLHGALLSRHNTLLLAIAPPDASRPGHGAGCGSRLGGLSKIMLTLHIKTRTVQKFMLERFEPPSRLGIGGAAWRRRLQRSPYFWHSS